jgi:L-fuculose-phosphate aldolase
MINYPSENNARRDIVEAGRRLYLRGCDCGSDGNLSARISDNAIIATPSGVSKGFMTEDMLVTLDLDGNVLSGALKPSSEIKMHIAVYRESPDILAVCHAHPPVAAAFAAAGVALDKPFLQESVMLLGVIPIAEYAPPGSDELANGAAAFCREYHGALLEHHGAVTWGGGVMQALYRMESVEYTATVAMYSKMLGFGRTLDNKKIAELISMRPQWGITAPLGGTGAWRVES